jgi:hypothetical protein
MDVLGGEIITGNTSIIFTKNMPEYSLTAQMCMISKGLWKSLMGMEK